MLKRLEREGEYKQDKEKAIFNTNGDGVKEPASKNKNDIFYLYFLLKNNISIYLFGLCGSICKLNPTAT